MPFAATNHGSWIPHSKVALRCRLHFSATRVMMYVLFYEQYKGNIIMKLHGALSRSMSGGGAFFHYARNCSRPFLHSWIHWPTAP